MLLSVEDNSSGRTQEEQAQIDGFYAKYFGRSAQPSPPKDTPVTVASDVPEESTPISQTDENIIIANTGSDGVVSEQSEVLNDKQPGLTDVEDSLVTISVIVATADGEEEAQKVEEQGNLVINAAATESKAGEAGDAVETDATADSFSSTSFCPLISDLSSSSTTTKQYKCGESADKPTQRTEYSASSPKQYDDWKLMSNILERMATKFGERIETERQIEQIVSLSTGLRGGTAISSDAATRKRPIIFIGDGIFESYLGTSYGQPSLSVERGGIVETFATTFSSPKYAPLIQAIEGDMTQHLLYRLQHGTLHQGYITDPTAIYVVLIGSSNLSAGHLPQETARGILAVVQELMYKVAGRVLLLQPLPRGDASTTLTKLCPTPFGGPRCDKEGQPLLAYKPGLDKVRYALENAMATLTHRYPGRIHLLQRCAQAFWPTEEGRAKGEEVNYDLMAEDGWHPNAKGHEAIGRCLMHCIEDGMC